MRGVDDETIRIGMWAPLTGPAVAWGAVARGTATYFDMINADGGIHGRRLELIVKDDGYQPARTVGAVRELVERDRVFALVGGVGTATGLAVLDYIVAEGVPWVSPASGATHWAYPPKPAVFAQTTPYVDEAAVLVEHAAQVIGASRIAVVYQNDDYGASGLVGARLAAEGLGMELVETLPVEVLDTDLTSHAIRLSVAEADAVLMWLTPRHATILLRAVAQLGRRPAWLASSALADSELMDELTGGGWAGVVFAAMTPLPGSGHRALERYLAAAARFAPEDRHGEFFLSGFRYAEPLVEGLQRAGPELTAEALVAALESLEDFQGIGAPLHYSPDDRQGARSIFLARSLAGGGAEAVTGWVESRIDIAQAIAVLDGSSPAR